MTAQRNRVAALRRDIKNAAADGLPLAFVERLRALLAAEERLLSGSREPGESRTVAELEEEGGPVDE